MFTCLTLTNKTQNDRLLSVAVAVCQLVVAKRDFKVNKKKRWTATTVVVLFAQTIMIEVTYRSSVIELSEIRERPAGRALNRIEVSHREREKNQKKRNKKKRTVKGSNSGRHRSN